MKDRLDSALWLFPSYTIEVGFTKQCNRTGEETQEARLIKVRQTHKYNFAEAVSEVQAALDTLGYTLVQIHWVKLHEGEE